MPTISAVMIADPSSPWKTVDDPLGARQDKYKDPKHEKKSKSSRTKAKKKAKPVRVAEDEMSDDETVLVGSPKNIVAVEDVVDDAEEINHQVEETKKEEDEETLVINNTSPGAVSLQHPAGISVDQSDMTIPLGQRTAATPTSKQGMGIILEADGSCGSIDNTDDLEDDDDEIIIPNRTPQVTSKAPAVSETVLIPRVSPLEVKEIQSSTPISAQDKDSPKNDSEIAEPSLNHMQEDEKAASIAEPSLNHMQEDEKAALIAEPSLNHMQKDEKAASIAEPSLNHMEEDEQAAEDIQEETKRALPADESGHDKENAGLQPIEKSPVKEAPRRSTRNRTQKKI